MSYTGRIQSVSCLTALLSSRETASGADTSPSTVLISLIACCWDVSTSKELRQRDGNIPPRGYAESEGVDILISGWRSFPAPLSAAVTRQLAFRNPLHHPEMDLETGWPGQEESYGNKI